ncbi:VPA1269 family protein [Vibrio splendidus]|uniref:VPA1269 family protein n=1 Tax=Vibrio splendidus TaxID=29497 RepID=UPI002735FB96|nr:VPA1269 family protein [Vibrio splendidus]MDP2588240.1 VPA1269 family protein [Vibrio splendidus]
MNINKKTLVKYVEDIGVGNLTDTSLIECFLVSMATCVSLELSKDLRLELNKREVCFSQFYSFAKNQWSTSYLVMLRKNATDEVTRFVEFFDSLNSQYGDNSAARQKGRLVACLYSTFYACSDFQSLTTKDADALFELIVDNYEMFKGDRPPEDNNLTRKDLKGLVTFIESIYKLDNKLLPSHYLASIIPDDLIKERGVSLSRGKSMNLGRIDQVKRYSLLDSIHDKYLNTLSLKTTKTQNAAYYTLLDYVDKTLGFESIKDVNELKELLTQGRSGSLRLLHVLEKSKDGSARGKATYIKDMMVWAMTEYHISVEHGFEPLFDNYEWDRIQRNKLSKSSSKRSVKDETPKAVIPMRVHQMAIDILCDPEYKWSKTLEDQFFLDGDGNRCFNPTLTNLLALIFQLPIRTIQAQVLDSGEGDEYRYDTTTLCWVLNDSCHAGYWKSKYAANPERGLLKRDQSLVVDTDERDANGDLVVRRAYMYINTNKTSDRSVAFSDVSGYTIPWHHDEVINIYERQYEFILKYHPLEKPTSHKNLERPQVIFGGKPTTSVLEAIPDRFYLFRCNLNKDIEHTNLPPSKKLIIRMWNHLMLEIESRLKSEGADFSVVDKDKLDKFIRHIGGGTSYISYLTPHCTRVTGITRLEEHGVPIHIISKMIAGHANVRTTYRYTKHDQSYVESQISEAQAKISSKMEISLTEELKSSTVEEARSLAYIPDIYIQSWGAVKSRCWNSNSLGICPNAGTLCEDGHEDEDIQFDGVGRCLNCKFLMSGKSHLINIWGHVNRLLYKAKELNDEYNDLQANYKSLLRNKKYEYKENGRSPEWLVISKQIDKVENHMTINSEDVNLVLSEVYFGNLLFERVRELTNNDDDYVDSLGFEECNKFEHMNSIVESNSFLPPFERDKELKFKRDTFVENALMAIGEKPIFLRGLTSDEKEKSLSEVAKMIENDLKVQEGKFLGAVLKLENMLG